MQGVVATCFSHAKFIPLGWVKPIFIGIWIYNQAEITSANIATKMNSDIVKYGSSKGKDEKYNTMPEKDFGKRLAISILKNLLSGSSG